MGRHRRRSYLRLVRDRGGTVEGRSDLQCDAVVIGAGHNGLVAAAYLAQAGLNVVVFERRDVIGGAAVTEELVPGFRVSTASYSLSLLRPDVYAALRLDRHGLVVLPKDPQMFVPLPDGRHFFVWRDFSRTLEELRRIHPPDADGYVRWSAFWDRAVQVLRPLADDPEPPALQEVERALTRRGLDDVWRLAVAGSAARCVEEFFEAPEIQGAFASQGIIGTFASVRDEGTAWVMAYHAIGGEVCGADGTWAYVRGGMGAVTGALHSAAAGLGARVRPSAPVTEILVERGRACGVRVADGTVCRAPVVVSGVGPRTTFLSLAPAGAFDGAFTRRVEDWKSPGSVVKVNLALSELPSFTAVPGTAVGPQHRGTLEISPSIDYLEAAFRDAQAGRPSRQPFMEVFLQSAVDDSLAPDGRHVLSAFSQYAPARPDPSEWPAQREAARKSVLGVLASYAPNIPDAVIASDVLGPPELEERFGLEGGNIFHGEILPEQSFGERFAYRTPVDGLYLCGSAASPGGGVMGAAGRNAARAVLDDLARRRMGAPE